MEEVGFRNFRASDQPAREPGTKRMYFLNVDMVREHFRLTGWNRLYRWHGLRYAAQISLAFNLPMRGGKKPRRKMGGVQRRSRLYAYQLES